MSSRIRKTAKASKWEEKR
jgi:hypothetical protein